MPEAVNSFRRLGENARAGEVYPQPRRLHCSGDLLCLLDDVADGRVGATGDDDNPVPIRQGRGRIVERKVGVFFPSSHVYKGSPPGIERVESRDFRGGTIGPARRRSVLAQDEIKAIIHRIESEPNSVVFPGGFRPVGEEAGMDYEPRGGSWWGRVFESAG